MKIGFWERRRARKAFEKYVSPEVLRLIEKDPPKYIQGPQLRHFQFVIVVLDDANTDHVAEMLEKVADAILRHGGMISNFSASIIVACLGVPFGDYDSVEDRLKLVNALIEENKGTLRIAHGQCHGNVGNMGCKERHVYQAVIPGFNNILKQLLGSSLGTVIEVSP